MTVCDRVYLDVVFTSNKMSPKTPWLMKLLGRRSTAIEFPYADHGAQRKVLPTFAVLQVPTA